MDEIKVIGYTYWNSKCQNVAIDSRETNDAVVKAVIEDLKENNYLYAGDEHQCDFNLAVPVLSNGKCVRCSLRAWGMFMAIAHDSNDYMSFYSTLTMDGENGKLPEKEREVNKKEFIIKDEDKDNSPMMVREDTEIMKTAIYEGMDFKTTDKVLEKTYPILKERIENQYD